MAVYTSSGSISIPTSVSSIKAILKGEGGAGADLNAVNCTWTSNISSPTTAGSCGSVLGGDGGPTTFLNAVAGGGRGGYYDNLNTGGPGGTFSAPTGIIAALNGNDGGPNTLGNNLGGIGPGGNGGNGTTDTYQYAGPTQSVGYGSSVPPCFSICPSASYCGYPGGVSPGPPGSCRCQPRVTANCYSPGGGAGAYVEVEINRQQLNTLGYLGTTQAFTVNEGTSTLDNGSADIILKFTEVYVKTSLGWQLVKDVYVNLSSVGIGWTVSSVNNL